MSVVDFTQTTASDGRLVDVIRESREGRSRSRNRPLARQTFEASRIKESRVNFPPLRKEKGKEMNVKAACKPTSAVVLAALASLILLLGLLINPLAAHAGGAPTLPVNLGTAVNYGVLGGAGVTSTASFCGRAIV